MEKLCNEGRGERYKVKRKKRKGENKKDKGIKRKIKEIGFWNVAGLRNKDKNF